MVGGGALSLLVISKLASPLTRVELDDAGVLICWFHILGVAAVELDRV